jgi:putative multiple sugar transport system permease protein
MEAITNSKRRLKAFSLRDNTMMLALIGGLIVFQIIVQVARGTSFVTPVNITNLINQKAYIIILAVGMLNCILTGGNIDLSVGSNVAMVSATAGVLMITYHMNVYLAMPICILVGTLAGALQAYFIAYVGVPPFITTLAGMLIYRGVTYAILTGGNTLSPFPQEMKQFFTGFMLQNIPGGRRVAVCVIIGAVIAVAFIIFSVVSWLRKDSKGYMVQPFPALCVKDGLIAAAVVVVFSFFGQHSGIPVVLISTAIVVIAYHIFTSKSVPGRHLYAIGGNRKATEFSGINTKRSMFFAYTNMGFLCGIAALVGAARFDSAMPSMGNGWEMDAIGSCFIGGASAYGGSGTVKGAVIGALFMGILDMGLTMLTLGEDIKRMIKGIVILAAVVLDVLMQKHSASGQGLFARLFGKKAAA